MDTQKIFPVIRKLPRQERPFETGRSAKESVQDEVEDRLRDASLWVKGKPNSWTTPLVDGQTWKMSARRPQGGSRELSRHQDGCKQG